MQRSPSARSSSGSAACSTRYGPRRLIAISSSQSSTSTSCRRMLRRITPALLTTACSAPYASTAARTARAASSASARSPGTASARPPAASTSAATASSGSGRRPHSTTASPSAARASAVARPMPVPPPVTSATRSTAAETSRGSTRIAAASPPPSTCSVSPKRTVSGPPNGWRSSTSSASPSAHAALGQVAQHRRVRVRDAHEAPAVAGLEVGQAARLALVDLQPRVGDRVAVRVVRRVAELGRDPRLEVLGDDVLERLGLLVHAVPRHAELLDEVELEQAVVAQHLERHLLALGRELHAPVRDVLGQARARRAS